MLPIIPRTLKILNRLALRIPLEVATGVEFNIVAGSKHRDSGFAGSEKEFELDVALKDGVCIVMSVM